MKILCIADIHAGSRLAPWPIGTSLEDNNEWGASRPQRWLNECWQLMCEDSAKWKPDVVILLGDLVEGIAPDNGELVTNNLAEQQGAAIELLSKAIPRKAELFVVKGTPRHEGLLSGITAGVARELNAKPTEGGTYVRPFLLLDTPAGYLFGIHHTSGGSLPWTTTAGSQRGFWLLRAEMAKTYGIDPGQVMAVITAHLHTSGIAIPQPGTFIGCLPGWQLKTAYGHKRMPFTFPDIGYCKIEALENGFNGKMILFKQPKMEAEHIGIGDRIHRNQD